MTAYVVKNDMVAHLWANQSQAEAHSPRQSFSFRGVGLFSYSMLIGRLVTDAQGRTVALITSRIVSPTTNKHVAAAKAAARHLPTFIVPELSGALSDHQDNLDALVGGVRGLLAKAKRCHLRDGEPWFIAEAEQRARVAEDYARAFGLPVPDFAPSIEAARGLYETRRARQRGDVTEGELKWARDAVVWAERPYDAVRNGLLDKRRAERAARLAAQEAEQAARRAEANPYLAVPRINRIISVSYTLKKVRGALQLYPMGIRR